MSTTTEFTGNTAQDPYSSPPYQLPADRRKTEDPRPVGKQPPVEAFRRESTGQFYAMSSQDRVAYETFCDGIVGDFNPQSHRERSLAVAIAEDTWRVSNEEHRSGLIPPTLMHRQGPWSARRERSKTTSSL